jgi:acylglycerol lipase
MIKPWRKVFTGIAALCFLGGAACASHPRIARPPTSPPDSSPTWLKSQDGLSLYYHVDAPSPVPRGVIWFVLGPEIASAPAYPRFYEALRAAGFGLAFFHARGSGYSEGVRGDVEDYSRMLGDYDQFTNELKQRYPSTPVFLLGHSVGGALALHLAARSPQAFAGVILVNPAFKMRVAADMGPSIFEYIAYGMDYVFRPSALTVDMNGDPSRIAHPGDRAGAEAMQNDPLVVRYFSLRYLMGQKGVMDRCAQNAARVSAPMLLLEGAEDTLIDPRGNAEILEASPSPDRKKVIVPGGGHGMSAVELSITELLIWLTAHSQ